MYGLSSLGLDNAYHGYKTEFQIQPSQDSITKRACPTRE